MTNVVLMPALSPTMTEGKLSRWLVKEGDSVGSGDVLAEIETDKAMMEVECVDEGVVARLVVEAGTESVLVNSLIAVILEEGEGAEDAEKAIAAFSSNAGSQEGTVSAEKSEVSEQSQVKDNNGAANSSNLAVSSSPTASVALKKSETDTRLRISPLAKKLALQNKIDVHKIKGSGPRGRIIKRDIERVLVDGLDISPVNAELVGAGAFSDAFKVSSIARADPSLPNSTLEEHSTMRKVIASRLSLSKQTIPHFYLSVDVEMDEALAFRKQINEQSGGLYKISVNDIVIKSLAHALVKEPKANAMWTDEGVRYFDSVDVAVAVAIPDGLITPVVRDAQTRGLVEISAMVKDLAVRAREGKLMPEEYQGGTVSVSNLGMYGVDHFQAIINPPQSCILAVGQSREMPVFVGENVVKRHVMTLTLSVDHRVVDGALAAQLLAAVRGFLSFPATMIL